MERNVGGKDKTVRLALGVVFVLAIFFVSAPLAKVLLGAAAGIAFGTALMGFCLFNRLLAGTPPRRGGRGRPRAPGRRSSRGSAASDSRPQSGATGLSSI